MGDNESSDQSHQSSNKGSNKILANQARPIHATPRSGSPTLRQLRFDWKVAAKYQELYYFEEGKNIFMNNNYNTQERWRVPVILN